MPPLSSKKRSSTSASCVGITPSARSEAARYSTAWRAAASPTPGIEASQAVTRGDARCRRRHRSATARRCDTSPRRSDTARDSSSLRAGASPSQNGIVGGAPRASSTRTLPGSILRMRHEVLPSWKMLPAMLSIAKSSLTLPTRMSPGSSTTS